MVAVTTPSTMRSRIVDAAVAMTVETGWSRVTMAALAERVGVSRQTVYNEVGTKPGLAEAMIHQELDRFLGAVSLAFDQSPDDLVGAIRAASAGVLELAQDNLLLHAVVGPPPPAGPPPGPRRPTPPPELGSAANRLAPYDLGIEGRRLEAAIDVVVRVVLSHVMQPSGDPSDTADDIAWIAARVLRA